MSRMYCLTTEAHRSENGFETQLCRPRLRGHSQVVDQNIADLSAWENDGIDSWAKISYFGGADSSSLTEVAGSASKLQAVTTTYKNLLVANHFGEKIRPPPFER